MTISGRAKLAGLIGDPVAQSLSPRLHAHWLVVHGVDGAYVPLAVARPDIQEPLGAPAGRALSRTPRADFLHTPEPELEVE